MFLWLQATEIDTGKLSKIKCIGRMLEGNRQGISEGYETGIIGLVDFVAERVCQRIPLGWRAPDAHIGDEIIKKCSKIIFIKVRIMVTSRSEDRTSYLICRAQRNMKMHDCLVKGYEEFRDGDCRAWNEAWDTSEHGALGHCTGRIPVKLPLNEREGFDWWGTHWKA